MPIKQESLENLIPTKKPTKWKKFKTKNPKTAKVLKVAAIGTGVTFGTAMIAIPFGAALGILSIGAAAPVIGLSAAAIEGTITGAISGAVSSVAIGVTCAIAEADVIDEKNNQKTDWEKAKKAINEEDENDSPQVITNTKTPTI